MPPIDIALKADGSIVRDLEIDDVTEPIRDRRMFPAECRGLGLGVLTDGTRVRFRTPARKTFTLGLDQFSFLVNTPPA